MTPQRRDELIAQFRKETAAYELAHDKQMFDPFVPLANDARYYMVFGERSNGKTYGALWESLLDYFFLGRPMAIIRRYHEDLLRRRAYRLMMPLVDNGWIERMTDGEWQTIYYNGGMWYLSRQLEGGKEEHSKVPFAYAYELTSQEHDKSSGDLDFKNIIFDEFISRSYLVDEFVLFMNTCSTIIRNKSDVRIWMCGNAINPYGCPYWAEMGIKHATQMQPGAMDVYSYGESDLRVCVYRTEPSGDKASSAVYFAFDNPKLAMITGGEWEIDIYPHIPHSLRPKDARFDFYVLYDDQVLHCKVIKLDNCEYLIVHPKTTPLKEEEYDTKLIYSLQVDPRRNWRRNLAMPSNPREKAIWEFFRQDKVFYSDNMTGEIMRNYREACGAI